MVGREAGRPQAAGDEGLINRDATAARILHVARLLSKSNRAPPIAHSTAARPMNQDSRLCRRGSLVLSCAFIATATRMVSPPCSIVSELTTSQREHADG